MPGLCGAQVVNDETDVKRRDGTIGASAERHDTGGGSLDRKEGGEKGLKMGY